METTESQELEIENAILWLERLENIDQLVKFWNLFGSYRMCEYPEIEK